MQDQDTPLSPEDKAAPELVENVAGAADAATASAGRSRRHRHPSQPRGAAPSGPELKAAEHHDAWLRAKAEAENIRRRAQDDIAKARKFAVEKFAGELLAGQGQPGSRPGQPRTRPSKASSQGVELTLKQLVSAFENAKR